jgi:single-stranded DNA-binding protein
MTIPTRECLVGEIASKPRWKKTSNGELRFFARIKVVAARQRPDGTWTEPIESFHNLVAYGHPAERARARLRYGDVVIAAGFTRKYTHFPDGEERDGEEFVVNWWGHEAWTTTYSVDRTRPPTMLPFRRRAVSRPTALASLRTAPIVAAAR